MIIVKTRSLLRQLVLLATLILGLGLPGCIIIDADSNTHVSGKSISSATYAQVKPGATKDYVLTLFGPPTNNFSPDAGSEIWAWKYSETRNSHGGILILFHTDNHTTTDEAVYVEFKDGVVTKIWRS